MNTTELIIEDLLRQASRLSREHAMEWKEKYEKIQIEHIKARAYLEEQISQLEAENARLRKALEQILAYTRNPNKPCRGDVAITAMEALKGGANP